MTPPRLPERCEKHGIPVYRSTQCLYCLEEALRVTWNYPMVNIRTIAQVMEAA